MRSFSAAFLSILLTMAYVFRLAESDALGWLQYMQMYRGVVFKYSVAMVSIDRSCQIHTW